jgi:hypothetical protein
MNSKNQVTTQAPSTALTVASIVTPGGAMTVSQIKANRALIKELMQDVMEKGKHYGTIKGTDKPTLLKPGAELLCSIFNIDPQPTVEDLSEHDCIRYRVTMKGVHIGTGASVGHGVGECSTDEEKYKWRACKSTLEWESVPEDRTRVKYGYNWEERREYTINQVRTNPADAANTVLKMASKRAKVDMVLGALAVSDIFGQDAEDLAEWLREGDDEKPPAATGKGSSTAPPKAKTVVTENDGKVSPVQLEHLRREIDKVGCGEKPVLLQFNIDTLEALPFAQLNTALKYVAGMQQEPPQ